MQFFKHSPINFRIPARINKDYNPKGLGLFVSGFCNLFRVFQQPDHLQEAKRIAEIVIELATPGFKNTCWGYNFPWQSRFFYQPPYFPTIVATSFIAQSLLDLFDLTLEHRYLDIARASCNFVLHDLNRTDYGEKGSIFSYSPIDHTQIFNASLLGAALLSRVYSITGEKQLADEARKAVLFCTLNQRLDGGWTYGLSDKQQWIDSFHTGYNLSSIADYANFCQDSNFNEYVNKGVNFYIKSFFTDDGIPRYYHNKIYPIDIHSAAQLPSTLNKTGFTSKYSHINNKVLNWTISHMQDPTGYFYYQIKHLYINRIPYIRWSQAWMFYCLTEHIKTQETK